MLVDNIKLLLRLFWRPASAISDILDQGSLFFASAAVLAVSLVLQLSLRPIIPPAPPAPQRTQAVEADPDEPPVLTAHAPPRWSFSFYSPLLVLAVVYVPGTLLVTSLIGRLGGFGVVFSRD